MDYKEIKKINDLYSNKVFSYKNQIHNQKNFSRKNFTNTWNFRVIFSNCTFEQTIFNKAIIDNCLFINCKFKDCAFVQCEITHTTFQNSKFNKVLFDRCHFKSSLFEYNNFSETEIYPTNYTPSGFTSPEINGHKYSEEELLILYDLLNDLKKQTYIRTSNTLFLKKSNRWSNSLKKELRKTTTKNAKKLGLSKKERLEENRNKKNQRIKIQTQHHLDALEGKNRIVSKGALNYLVNLYSFEDLIKGLSYAEKNINKTFTSLSYLIKFVDEGIAKNI